MAARSWRFPEPVAPADLRRVGDYPALHAEILFRRGLTTDEAAARFLTPQAPIRAGGASLRGVDAAVERLLAARSAGENVVIFGDYDADGVTSTAILLSALSDLGWKVSHYIPNRFDEGYGLNQSALESIREAGGRLVVTVDCGIRSVAEVAWAQSQNLDMIITDHHQPGDELPPARAVIDPRRLDETYPSPELAGSGVAYKLAQAVTHALGEGDPDHLLDLVALGTIADLAPLTGENRSLVAAGLSQMRSNPRPGVVALASVARVRLDNLRAGPVGFSLAPRLNASGRLETAEAALALLRSEVPEEAITLAGKLDDLNRERQRLTRETTERAREMIVSLGELPPLLIAGAPDFPEGVIGLAAARLVEEFHRPAIVATIGDEVVRGSARSIPEFPITPALDTCRQFLLRYGGHAVAAGFSASLENWPLLQEAIVSKARTAFADGAPEAVLRIDAVVAPDDLREDLAGFLDLLEPCGNGNPRPILALLGAEVIRSRRVGSDARHLKLTVRAGKRIWDAIAFRQTEDVRDGSRLDLGFLLERNDYLGVPSLQLNVVGLRESSAAAA